MAFFSSPAILLRRISHSDYDLIVTFLTPHSGKMTTIAKNAKKSQKRFSGLLEPFSQLNIVFTISKGKMPVLQEASLKNPFSGIRGNILKTAYACYWSELIDRFSEGGKAQLPIYNVLKYCLQALESESNVDAGLSIIFQMRFLSLSGLAPNLTECATCKIKISDFGNSRLIFELAKGGLVCQGCSKNQTSQLILSNGTVKQLLWIQNNSLDNLKRLKFTRSVLNEGLNLLEAFVPYHLGRQPKSFQFLRGVR